MLRALRTMGRDNARTPVQWTGGPQAGFTTGTPWLPVNPNHVSINAEAERADPDSVFHHYRRVIELRHSLPVIADGDFTMLLPDDPRVYAYVRTLDGVELLVLGNFSRRRCRHRPPGLGGRRVADRLAGTGSGSVGGEGAIARRIWNVSTAASVPSAMPANE